MVSDIHKNDNSFGKALDATSATTRFSGILVEKDYYCTLLLEYLSSKCPDLVFKGGTCLSKVYADFYRLSEDLDFSITPTGRENRTSRSNQMKPLEQIFSDLPKDQDLDCFQIGQGLKGANESKHYGVIINYRSLLSEDLGTIKIDIDLRGALYKPGIQGAVNTMLINPDTGRPALSPIQAQCISFAECIAEKILAALSRKYIAVRDFYDIDHAVYSLGLDPLDGEFFQMLKDKKSMPDERKIDLGVERLAELRDQLDTDLRPVLRSDDFKRFDLDRAIKLALNIAARLEMDDLGL